MQQDKSEQDLARPRQGELSEAELKAAAGGRRTRTTDQEVHEAGPTRRRDTRLPHRTRPFEPDL